ncbi:MAG: GNAT family N-acetyltransferase [Gammaproteobacteria bacterium]|nr:GNAT family N-acetyltransferase [Gammaproteobacteria bacterium]
MVTGKLSARELRQSDIDLIADYWSQSTPDHLIGMGVDLKKLPARSDFVSMLSGQLGLSPEDRQSYCTIWEVDNQPVGHCNVNSIKFGEKAHMHLHLWRLDLRFRGAGVSLVRMSLPFFFERLQLKDLYCEPNSGNRAANRVLEKVGFYFIQTYKTVPGSIMCEQDVNRWHLSRTKYAKLMA